MNSPIPPSLGRIVLFQEARSAAVVPAAVTKVHTNNCVNLIVFQDGQGAFPRTSIMYSEDPECVGMRWFWMDYQKTVAGVA